MSMMGGTRDPSNDDHTGINVEGGIHVKDGDVVVGDQFNISEDLSRSVAGLENPYFGLRSYEYKDQQAFGGRDRLVAETVKKITTPGSVQPVLFITGASGCGKSSFAKAGLLPALEAHYKERNLKVERAIMNPSKSPVSMLGDAFLQLNITMLSSSEISQLSPQVLEQILVEQTPKNQVNLLVIDQFEECFTQSDPDQQKKLFGLLAAFPAFDQARTHIIITMRSDFLDELYNEKPIYNYIKTGVDLRSMSVEELGEAIQKPLIAAAQGKQGAAYQGKCFEPALIQNLAEDAATDPSYLPLLQLTLYELWEKGSLKLADYAGLTDAVQRIAEAVYRYQDYTASQPCQERSQEDKDEIMAIFLELVDVSPDDDQRRDVRKRRKRSALIASDPNCENLISDLIEARLLTVITMNEGEDQVEFIDIIHESLIKNWTTLRDAISEERHLLRTRARFEQTKKAWLDGQESDKYRLENIALEEARELVRKKDIAFQDKDAQKFLKRSEYLHSRRIRTIRYTAVGLAVALLVAVITAGIAMTQSNNLADARSTAQALYISANESAGTAVAEKLISDQAKNTAVAAEANAVAQQQAAENAEATAQAERERAEGQARISLARQLSNRAQELLNYRPNQLEPATLLSIESLRLSPERAGNQALVDSLELLPSIIASTPGSGAMGITFSPDGENVLAYWDDGTIYSWDPYSEETLVYYPDVKLEDVSSISLSPDQQLAASGSRKGVIEVWNVITGEPVASMNAGSYIYMVALSPNNSLLVSGNDDNSMTVWDVTRAVKLFDLPHDDSVFSVAFSNDGSKIVSGCENGAIIVWDTSTGREIIRMRQSGEASAVAFSPDGMQVVSGSFDGTTRVWNLSNGNQISSLDHLDRVTSVAFSPDGQHVVSSSWDGTDRLWEAASGHEISRMASIYAKYSSSFSPDGKKIVSFNADKIVVWQAASGQRIAQVDHQNPVYGVDISPNGKWVASASDDCSVKVWDAQTGEIVQTVWHANWIRSVQFSPDGEMIVSGGGDNTARVWDIESGAELASISHEAPVLAVAFSPDGRYVASGSDDKTARILDLTTNEIKVFSAQYQVSSVDFSRRSDYVVFGSYDGTAQVWNVSTGAKVAQISHEPGATNVDFSSANDWVVSTSQGSEDILVWNGITGELIVNLADHLSDDAERQLAALAVFSPDGLFVASGDWYRAGAIRIWNAATGEEIQSMPVGTWSNTLEFSPDSKWLLSGTGDDTIRVWEVETGREIARMTSKETVTAAGFDPQGQFVVSADDTGAVRTWRWNYTDLIEIACNRLQGNLTRNEWVSYFGEEAYRKTCPNLP